MKFHLIKNGFPAELLATISTTCLPVFILGSILASKIIHLGKELEL